MAERIRIRTRRVEGNTDVLILMPHPMETGLRKDAAGRPRPAHYITAVEAWVDERRVLSARLSIAVAQDPLLNLRLQGDMAGRTLRVAWTDNLGEQRSDTLPIA